MHKDHTPTHSSMHMSTLHIHTPAVSILLILHFLVILPHFTLFSAMGKLNYDTQITHFSHPHPLELNVNELVTPLNMNTGNPIISTYMLCAGCKLPANDSDDLVYSCNQCNFHLHLSCTNFARLITHPSHPSHPLALLPVCTYPGGIFNCDACLRRGHGFNYHCDSCDFDLHAVCASKPLAVVHHSHEHPLMLTLKNPYETKGFSCDICSKIGSKQWLYRCGICDFDAHLHCATGTQLPPLPPQRSVGRNQPRQSAGRSQNQGPPKRSRTDSGSSGRLQGSQSFSAVANQPDNRSNGLQMLQSFSASAGRPDNYYGSEQQQQQQSYQLTSGGGMQLNRSCYPDNYYGSGMQPQQQSYPLTSGGEMQPNQSYPVTAGMRMQPQMSYPGTGEGAMHLQQSYPLTGGTPQYYPVTGGGGFSGTGGGAAQPQQAYPAASGGLMNAATQGLVEGAAQQVGQSFMQSLIGGNGGDGSTSSIPINLRPTYAENQESNGTQDY